MTTSDPTTRRKRRILGAVGGVAVGILAVLVIGTAITSLATLSAIRGTQVSGVERSKDTKTLAEQIQSCTTPGGACYERSQKQTAKAVGAIGAANRKSAAAAAWCARDFDTYATILRCVNRQLGIPPKR